MYEELLINDFYDLVIDTIPFLDDNEQVAIIAKYEEAIDILKELLNLDQTSICNVEIWGKDWDGYDQEFLIDITPNYEIYCEKMIKKDGCRIKSNADIVYILENCNSKAVNDVQDEKVIVVTLD